MIRSNKQWRQFKSRYEVPEAELERWFDWMKVTSCKEGCSCEGNCPKVWPEEDYTDGFFSYRGVWYHLSDFMRGGEEGWDGYHGDSYFSGVLIKLSDDGEEYQVGTYIHMSEDIQ